MHIKLVTPGSYHFSEPASQLVKVSSRGLIGADRIEFEKRAGVDFAHQLEHIKVAGDEPLLHVLIIGATEDYGPNRNGDGFTRSCCRNHHQTFTKHARFYRDHKNKDTSKSYGIIKAAAWNEPMKRIELLVGLNGTKEAAARNGGLLADKELEKLASGREIAVSMACRVPYDVCSWCGNKAATREEYCTSEDDGGHCKAGGLKNNIGRLVEMEKEGKLQVHHLHADNPTPCFFDCSHVWRPADRIAYVVGELEKAASASGRVVTGAELATAAGVTIPYNLLVSEQLPGDVQQLLKLAYVLADAEQELETGSWAEERMAAGFSREVTPSLATPPQFYREKFAYALRALADAHICLSPEQFLQLTTDHPIEKIAAVAELVRTALPGVYTRLLGSGDFVEKIARNPYVPAASANPSLRLWAEKQASQCSLHPADVQRRAWAAFVQTDTPAKVCRDGSLTKTAAAASDPVHQLAEAYALYKLAFLRTQAGTAEFPLTQRLVLLQNYAQT